MEMQVILDNLENALNNNDELTAYDCIRYIVRTVVYKKGIYRSNAALRRDFISTFITDLYMRILYFRNKGEPIKPYAIYRYAKLFYIRSLGEFKHREESREYTTKEMNLMIQRNN